MMVHSSVLLVLCVVGASILSVTSYGMDKMLGPGRWFVINTDKCANDDALKYRLNVERKRINRTHDAFDGYVNLLDQVDDTYGLRLSACKFVDGGCKPFQEIVDECFCCFLKKHAEVNFLNVLSSFGLDPPDCPVPPGEYTIKDFIYDYNGLPAEGFYGKYLGQVYITKDNVDLGCIAVTSEFLEAN